jgi:hypothetical protein
MTTLENQMMERAEQQFRNIEKLTAGSEEHAKATTAANITVDRLNKMREIRIEEKKLEIEREKLKAEEKKLEIEREKLKAEQRNNLIKTLVTIATFTAGAGITIWANVDSKKFEGAYTHTTSAGRQSESKLLSFMDRVKV